MLQVLNLNSYESPKAIEDRRLKWVAYGDDNNYYQFLIDSYMSSATNNAAIKSIVDQVFGEGLSILEMEDDSDKVKELKKLVNQKDLKKLILERKMLGQAAAQVIYTGRGNKRQVKEIKHFPIHTLRPERADEYGNINAYYYHPNWKAYKQSDKLKRIPTFGNSKENIELYIIKPYLSGYTYFCPVDYSGALPYAELESEIGKYLLNDIQNGFSGSKVINFNNGVPDKESRDMITQDVKRKLTGARGEKVIVAFNESADNKTTVEDLPLNDAPAHYEYLADEARGKILVGHRVTSPMLLGIRDGKSGLGNNADEIMTASQLFHSTVIKTYQDEFISFLEEVLELNSYDEKMYFVNIQPIEFQEGAEDAEDAEEKEERTGNKGRATKEDSKKKADTNLSSNKDFEESRQIEWLRHLNKVGEENPSEDKWELVNSTIDKDESESDDIEANLNKAVMLTAMKPSKEDTKLFKVRYAYVHRSKKKSASSKKSSRAFCRALESANKVYRKEDILKMKGMNTELGHNGQPYSIWLHSGGVNCYHGWERRIYKKRIRKDGEPYGGAGLTNTRKVSVNDARKAGYKAKPQSKRVAEANIDRADKGHHPNYRK